MLTNPETDEKLQEVDQNASFFSCEPDLMNDELVNKTEKIEGVIFER
jgi:hypothetical protein